MEIIRDENAQMVEKEYLTEIIGNGTGVLHEKTNDNY